MEEQRRRALFEYLFKGMSGYLCIATINRKGAKSFVPRYFMLPDKLDDALTVIDRAGPLKDVYFCPNLFTEPNHKSEFVTECPTVWADLDDCHPDSMLVEPTIVLETSPNRFQALWKLAQSYSAQEIESIAKRIAYFHKDEGADDSGWDLAQLLRVPYTYNNKYPDHHHKVAIWLSKPDNRYEPQDFSEYPILEEQNVALPMELPDKSAKELLEEGKSTLNPRVFSLFGEEVPVGRRSSRLWELELSLLESGYSREETFIVAREAACNKYAQEGRDESLLWKEIVKAQSHVQHKRIVSPSLSDDTQVSPILTDDERSWAKDQTGFVEEYIEWASNLTDASWQYHQAGAFIVLSTIVTGAVRLPTSFGTLLPNLWFMILADTTLTRKSTAMDIAVDLLEEVDPDGILATDGSIEGLLTSLSMRPGRPSVFLRDEFTGLMEQINKRDYYAGMLETFTKLYDGRFMKRMLRKEEITVREPVFILFAGGIKTRMTELLSYQHISSGFLPRFIFITADADVTKMRPMGPPTEETTGGRDELKRKLKDIRSKYWSGNKGEMVGNKLKLPKAWNAKLTKDAWWRFNQINTKMTEDAWSDASVRDLMVPCMDRLSKSGLKAAVLMKAADYKDADKLVLDESDIVRAFYYVEQWREHTLYIVNNVGTTSNERRLQQVMRFIRAKPGCLRSDVMKAFKLDAKQSDAVFNTLEQRGVVKLEPLKGRGYKCFPIDV